MMDPPVYGCMLYECMFDFARFASYAGSVFVKVSRNLTFCVG